MPPRSGEPHPQFPGCYWSPPLNDYACDDGYALNSGQELPKGWEQSILGIQSLPPNVMNDDTVRITELGEVTGAQLSNLIRGNNGKYDTTVDDPLVAYAQTHWWQFSVQMSDNGRGARITESNLLFYGGLAVVGLVVVIALSQ